MVFVHNFKNYKVSYTKNAQKDLKNIDSPYAQKIKQKFNDLISGLPNSDIKRLQGKNNHIFRLRVGIYRALFEVYEHTITIYVISVEHRKDVYDNL